jgi:hypothetical protein
VGLVDVMELMCSTASSENGKGWRDFFSGAMDARNDNDDNSISDTASNFSYDNYDASRDMYALNMSHLGRGAPPNSVRGPAMGNDAMSDIFSISGVPTNIRMEDPDRELFTFKVDHRSGTHRIKCLPNNYDIFCNAVSEKTGIPEEDLILKYVDGDGDIITVSGNSGLKESVEYARAANMTILKLTAQNKNGEGFIAFVKKPSRERTMAIGGVGLIASALAIGAFFFAKPKK